MVQISRLADKYFHDAELAALRKRNEVMEKALEHYAAVNNWICPLDTCTTEDCPHGETLYLGSDDSSEWFHGYSVAQQALAEIRSAGQAPSGS